jgi:hypothetical protein
MVTDLGEALALELSLLGVERQSDICKTEVVIREHEDQKQFKAAKEVRESLRSVARMASDRRGGQLRGAATSSGAETVGQLGSAPAAAQGASASRSPAVGSESLTHSCATLQAKRAQIEREAIENKERVAEEVYFMQRLRRRAAAQVRRGVALCARVRTLICVSCVF